ncbi:MAG: PD40 domain-containing protein [Saprospiraceae bacterium]|nr:PD40 domain-containing protein [Saprospiraceae bacterium]
MTRIKIVSLLIIFILGLNCLNAQYFGRNKPRYRNFNFKVLSTPHFDIHHYLKNKEVATHFAGMAEQWYDYHSQVIGDTIQYKNPVILYNNHAEFQQTNAISGTIGVGTGGVTEAFKNRVVMPLTFSNQTTWQVLGHELVHAFQFYTILNGDSTNLQSLGNLPLWMVEGMAEYMSLGRTDPFTSMWMRDAVVNNDVPTLMKMDHPDYFPYRYGQAFWSFMTGTYGDGIIAPLFQNTAVYGLPIAIELTLNLSVENLSNMWVNGLKNHYEPYLRDKKESPPGKKIFSEENSGKLNVCPSISPNGRYVIFLSEKDLFSTDLYLADARTGKIINKVASLIKDTDLDNFNYLESSGSWSPDGKDFAFVGIKKGKNVLVVKDADAGKTIQTITIPGLDAFSSPTWSPDKVNIVVTGLVEGQVDLFMYHMKTKKLTQLTNDIYSEILPGFNDDGSRLAFSYDKKSMDEGRINGAYTYDLAIMNMADKTIEVLDVFHGAENLNPSFDHEGNLYFISERDGKRNLYRYLFASGEVMQMTDLLTGISGITRYSPAISVSTKRDKVMYTHYFNHNYSIWEASSTQLLNKRVDAKTIDQSAGVLPVLLPNKKDIVNANLRAADNYTTNETMKDNRYKPKFRLDFIGGATGVGVGNNSLGNAVGLQGGVNMLFSDMLGNHQMFTQVALNGEILDFAGQVAYLNRTNRIAWGVGFSHIPLRTGFQDYGTATINNIPYLISETNLIRIFDKTLSVFAHYPFSSTLRLEGGLSGTHRGFRQDLYRDYYQIIGNSYYYVDQERERIPVGDQLYFNDYYTLVRGYGAVANVALVGDNSYFGLTSPLAGYRYRFGVDKSFGADDYYSFIADYRKYYWMKPISLAFRFTGISRFENKVNSVFPYYVGNMGFVRGYGSIISTEIVDELQIDFNQLLGSKMAVAGFEVRLPFTGPKQLALIGSNFLLTDLALFFDAGVAFDQFSHFRDGELTYAIQRDANGQIVLDNNGDPLYAYQNLKPAFARSAGLALRINLFGAIILEPYYARQLESKGRFTFGLNLIPGW